MDKPPFFTVIVPTYNQAQYLGRALDSLLAQTDPDWEAVVVNDGSTDSTPEVLKTYCSKDSRFRVIHKENGGVASALNAGLRQAEGKWICWLSSDDLFDTRKLAIHRECIARYPSCRFFFTHYRFLDDATGQLSNPVSRAMPAPEWQLLEMLRGNYVYGNSVCVHREAWARAGMFNEKLPYGQDYDMWLRLFCLYPATFIPERTCITRFHPHQATQKFPKGGLFDSAKAAINFLNEHSFAELVPWIDLTCPQMARKALLKALDVAADRSAFMYALGPHPALLIRIMEWAGGINNTEIAAMARRLVRRWTAEVSYQYSGTAFGFFWKTAYAASRLPECRLTYQSIAPAKVAQYNYWLLTARGDRAAEPLHYYLKTFENTAVSKHGAASKVKSQEIVIVCQKTTHLICSPGNKELKSTLDLAKHLMKMGHLVLLTGLSEQGIGFVDDVFFLGANDDKNWKRGVSLLSPIGLLIGISRGDIYHMACALRYLNLNVEVAIVNTQNSSGDKTSFHEHFFSTLDNIESIPIQTSRIGLIICSLGRHGQIKGIFRRMISSRIGKDMQYILRTFSNQRFTKWPNLLRDMRIERKLAIKIDQ